MNPSQRFAVVLLACLCGDCRGDAPRSALHEQPVTQDASIASIPRDLAAARDAGDPPDEGAAAKRTRPARAPARTVGEQEGAPEWAEQDPTDYLALTMFQQAPPSLAAPVLKDARIVCVVSDPSPSVFAFLRHGIPTVAHFGAAPPTFHKGLGGSGLSQFIVPVGELRTGDLLTVSRSEREDWATESPADIRDLYVRYEGRFPIKLQTPGVDVECRAFTREQLEAALPARLTALGAAMKKVRLTVIPGKDDVGRDASGLPVALRRLYEAAAYVGWTDERIRSRSTAVAQLLERWNQLASAAAQRLAAPLSPPGTWIEVKGVGRVRALPLRCVPKDLSRDAVRLEYHDLIAANCFVEFEITPVRLMATEQIYCAMHERSLCLGQLRLILANGTTTRPLVYQVRPAGTPFTAHGGKVKDLAAGQTHVIVLEPRIRVVQETSPLHPTLLQGSFGTLRLP